MTETGDMNNTQDITEYPRDHGHLCSQCGSLAMDPTPPGTPGDDHYYCDACGWADPGGVWGGPVEENETMTETAIVPSGDNAPAKPLCATCEGAGWVAVSDHHPDCRGFNCGQECPVQVQAPCPECGYESEPIPDVEAPF